MIFTKAFERLPIYEEARRENSITFKERSGAGEIFPGTSSYEGPSTKNTIFIREVANIHSEYFVSSPTDEISPDTRKMIEQSMANLAQGSVGKPLDLSKFHE